MMSEVKVLQSIIEWCGGDKSCAYHAGLHSELERYANSRHGNQSAHINRQQQRITELEKRNSHLEAQLPKWFGADSKYPNSDQECLVVLGNENVCLATWDADAGAFDSIGINWITEYTHWMPLPQPPKEQGDE